MQLNEALHHVHAQIELVSAALLQKEGAPPVQDAVELLRDCMVAFSGLASQWEPAQFTPEAVARMREMSQTLALQREHLVRLGVITTQQAQTLVPQYRDGNTYGSVGGSTPQGGRASVAKLYHISG